MTKTVIKIGNSQGIILDAALMELAHLKVGDQVNVTVQEDGTIILIPTQGRIHPDQATAFTRRLLRKNTELFRRLS